MCQLRDKDLLSDSNPSSGEEEEEEEEEGVVRYRGRVKGDFGAKKAPFFCSIGVRTRDVPLYL